jgi:hypothetical protein
VTTATAPPRVEVLTADDLVWDLAPVEADAREPADAADVAVDALLDAEAYRTLAQTAIHALAALRVQHARLQAIHADSRKVTT